MEFLWRNQKIESSYKTFRYYILAAIGLWTTEGKSVFAQKKTKIAIFSDQIVKLAKSEEALKASMTSAVDIIEARLAEMGVSNQERIRDAIRSESFSSAFREKALLAV